MGTLDRLHDKGLWVPDLTTGLVETADKGAACNLSRLIAFGMPAHTVHYYQECTLVTTQDSDPVLILVAVPNEADFCCFVTQAATRGLLDYPGPVPREARV